MIAFPFAMIIFHVYLFALSFKDASDFILVWGRVFTVAVLIGSFLASTACCSGWDISINVRGREKEIRKKALRKKKALKKQKKR